MKGISKMGKEVLDSNLRRLELFSKLQNIKKKTGMVVQSLLFSKDKFDKKKAMAWAKKQGYKASQVTESDNFFFVRQKNPGKFKDYRTIVLSDGIKARVAGNMTSKFVGYVTLKGFSKFQDDDVKSELDLKIPLEVEMRFLCEGTNRDGMIRREDLEASLESWSELPIIDWHDMSDMKNPTAHKISDRKGYLGKNPTLKMIEGKEWITNTAYITDRYLAYLIYLAEKNGKPLEISPEYGWTPYFMGGQKHQSNIRPHLITIVDKGHIQGNRMSLLSS